MPVIFKDDSLTDYFVDSEVAPSSKAYESAKVISFPRLKLSIDHDFWANLPTDEFPQLKKLKSLNAGGDDPALDAGLAALPGDLASAVRAQIDSVLDQVMPAYETIFSGYVFTDRRAVWRLNTIHNEKLHIDTGVGVHMARLFINLDNQPRIWTTSYLVSEMIDRWDVHGEGPAVRKQLNKLVFGHISDWRTDAPRHVIYFQPGEAWAVDSRKVAHQIFYGRRALSIDFCVDTNSMHDPAQIIDETIQRQLKARAEAAPSVQKTKESIVLEG